jgi:hypothetical protein
MTARNEPRQNAVLGVGFIRYPHWDLPSSSAWRRKFLHELYLQLSAETLEKGLYTFAQFPPDDSSYLTTRLWDAYLPDWRKNSKNVVDVRQEIKEALKKLIEKYQQANAARKSATMHTDNLAFVELSRQIKPKKGRLLSDREGRCFEGLRRRSKA